MIPNIGYNLHIYRPKQLSGLQNHSNPQTSTQYKYKKVRESSFSKDKTNLKSKTNLKDNFNKVKQLLSL